MSIPETFDLRVYHGLWRVTLLRDAASARSAVLSRHVWRASSGFAFVEVEYLADEPREALEERVLAGIGRGALAALP